MEAFRRSRVAFLPGVAGSCETALVTGHAPSGGSRGGPKNGGSSDRSGSLMATATSPAHRATAALRTDVGELLRCAVLRVALPLRAQHTPSLSVSRLRRAISVARSRLRRVHPGHPGAPCYGMTRLEPAEEAERVGFEPTDPLRGHRFSKPAQSAALAPLLSPPILPLTRGTHAPGYIVRKLLACPFYR